MTAARAARRLGVACGVSLAAALAGCVNHPPTVAHVHIGHAITAVPITPNHDGYLVVAERRAQEADAAAQQALNSTDLSAIKRNVAVVVVATGSDDDFGVRHAIEMAANHVSFAATSDDASLNVQRSAPSFASHATTVIQRSDLILLLGKDVEAAHSLREAQVSANAIAKLTQANLNGDDSNGDGMVGSAPEEIGLRQLRGELEAMIARESPPYTTVEQWYLFNLVRLPSGRWVFDKLGRGGNIEGYK